MNEKYEQGTSGGKFRKRIFAKMKIYSCAKIHRQENTTLTNFIILDLARHEVWAGSAGSLEQTLNGSNGNWDGILFGIAQISNRNTAL